MSIADLRWPRTFAAWGLSTGKFPQALACVALALAFSTIGAYRVASTVRLEELVFGPGRSPIVDALLAAFGTERTAVLVYMLERSFNALVVATALTPIFLWLLGSSAMHAAARLRGLRGQPYVPLLVLFAYAELVYQVPTSIVGIALVGGPGTVLADVIGFGMLLWFALVVYRGIELHYGVTGDHALTIFVIGTLAFYLLPLVLIVIALVAIVVAAAMLQYF